MFDLFAFIIDVLIFGDWLGSISDGDATERESQFYAAPPMRRLRWLARAIVLVYVVAVAAIPAIAVFSRFGEVWLSGMGAGGLVATFVFYLAAVIAGFVVLALAAKLAAEPPG